MPVTITETDAFPSAVQMPVAGELASAPGLLAQLVQGTVNRTRWLYNRAKVFIQGGALASTGSVALTSASGSTYQVNDLAMPSVDDGGGLTIGVGNLALTQGSISCLNVRALGFLRDQLRVSLGNTSAGVHTYSSDNWQHIYAVAGPTIGAGCAWQIDESVTVGSEWFRFVNFNAMPIAVNNPAGILLQTIKFGTGFAYAITVAKISGTWTVIDAAYTP